MIIDKLGLAEEVKDYIACNNTQEALQDARTELRLHRIGRAATSQWEADRAEVVRFADKLLKQALSAKLMEYDATDERLEYI